MAVSKRLRYEVLKRDEHTCQSCGRTAPEVKIQVDHVIPVALGGRDEPSNLRAACIDCNVGKSSVPADAPLIEEVADKALAWAEAMRIVADERKVGRAAADKQHAKFRKEWNAFKDWRGNSVPLDAGWKNTIDQLLSTGLEMADLFDMVDVAMSAKAKDTWRYFCGCCWRRVSQIQDRAAEFMQASESAKPTLADAPLTAHGASTSWTTEEVEDYYAQNRSYGEEWCTEEDFNVVSCRHISSGGGHCEDPICLVEYAASLHWVAQVRESMYTRRAAQVEVYAGG